MDLRHIQVCDSCPDLKTASILPQCRVWKQQLDRLFLTPFGSWRPLYGLFACISFVLYLRSIFQPRALFKARWYAGTAWFHGKPHCEAFRLRSPFIQLLNSSCSQNGLLSEHSQHSFKGTLHWWCAKGTWMQDSANLWLLNGSWEVSVVTKKRRVLPSRSATSGVRDGQRTATSGMVFQPGGILPEGFAPSEIFMDLACFES